MAVLSINGINAGALIAAGDEPKGERRDIGEMSQATDGTLSITRQARKRDLRFKSVPITRSDADAWESLIIGEGEVWSFDSSLYGSKGLGPSANVGCTQQTNTSKFGTGRLHVPDTTGSISFPAASNIFGKSTDWSVGVYRSTDGAFSWAHTFVRSDGAKWIDGVRNDGASTTWLSVTSGVVTIENTGFASFLCDDLVILPFKVLDAWPPLIYARAAAYPPAPYVDLTGDWVTEQSARRALGMAAATMIKTASTGSRVRLDVEFKAK